MMTNTSPWFAVLMLALAACGEPSDIPWPDPPKVDAGGDADAGVDADAATDDDGLVTPNDAVGATAPTAAWLTPAEGAVVGLGQDVTFTANVSSPYLEPTELSLQPTLTTGPLLGVDAIDVSAAGVVTFHSRYLPPGDVTVLLRVLDGKNPATVISRSLFVDIPPGAPVVTISPAKPGGADDLVAVIETPAADPDQLPTTKQTYQYRWFKNDLATEHVDATLPASATFAGEVWLVEVRAFDGVSAGPPGFAFVPIGNTAPDLPTLAIEPTPTTVADTIVCAMPKAATDIDDQDLSFKASWTKNGQPFAEAGHKGTLALAAFVPGKNGKPGAYQQLLPVKAGDVLQCQMLVSDGFDISGPATSPTATLLPFNGCDHSEPPCALYANCTPTDSAEVTCTCKSGYIGDGKVCVDRDECTDGSNPCAVGATCTNTVGGYTCACDQGWTGDGWLCQNVDECQDVTPVCAESATCVDTPGSYACKCKPGWVDAGGTCVDQNECVLGLSICDPNATCVNLPGSVTCACDLGYEMTETKAGAVCVDTDECAAPMSLCTVGALCTNLPGSFDCTCGPGWLGDGKTCSNVDECKAGTFVCAAEATCKDSEGAYECLCGPGYTGDGKVCFDVDECAAKEPPCDPKAACTNKTGSYACACKPGFEGDGKTCKAVTEQP